MPAPVRIFTLSDFSDILALIKSSSPLIGGQAVAWWARRYQTFTAPTNDIDPLASHDIDFWGDRHALKKLAKALGKIPKFPHEYEMTVWTGSIDLWIKNQSTLVKFLHAVVGLDTDDPDIATLEQEYGDRRIRVLDPISLIYSKIHDLRVFDQTNRQDLFHLQVCIATAKPFIEEVAAKDPRLGLWYCERVLKCANREVNRKLAKKYHLNLLEAIPISYLEQLVQAPQVTADDRQRLRNFLEQRWPRVPSLR